MATYLVAAGLPLRPEDAMAWLAARGLPVDNPVNDLEQAAVDDGDVVIGTLPVDRAAEVCTRGGRYGHITLDLRPEWGGRDLSVDEVDHAGARVQGYLVTPVHDGSFLGERATFPNDRPLPVLDSRECPSCDDGGDVRGLGEQEGWVCPESG